MISPDRPVVAKLAGNKLRDRLKWNIGASVIQAFASMLIVVLLYRYLMGKLGPEILGAWSLVSAFIGIARIGELGISVSMSKMLAESNEHASVRRDCSIFPTGMWIAIVSGCICVSVSIWFVSHYVHLEIASNVAVDLIKSTALATLFSIISSPMRAGLDGIHRADLRQLANFSQQFMFLAFSILFIPYWGASGFAVAQASSALFGLVVIAVLAKRVLITRFTMQSFNMLIARRMLSIGLPMQGSLACQQFYEPLTKLMLERLGGLAAVSVFEIANKLIIQLRSLIVSAMEPLVPYISSIAQNNDNNGKRQLESYRNTISLVWIISFVGFGSVICMFPLASLFLLGNINNTFLLFGLILAIAWGINTLSAPAFFFMISTDMQRQTLVSFVIIAIGNWLFATVLAIIFGEMGVVLGWGIALSSGSFYIIYIYQKRSGINFKKPAISMIGRTLAAFGAIILTLLLSKNVQSIVVITLVCITGSVGVSAIIVQGKAGKDLTNRVLKIFRDFSGCRVVSKSTD